MLQLISEIYEKSESYQNFIHIVHFRHGSLPPTVTMQITKLPFHLRVLE